MERGGDQQEQPSERIKRGPSDKKPRQESRRSRNKRIPPLLERLLADGFGEASRADHLVVVLGDAFAAEVKTTDGTARDGFPLRMILTNLKVEAHSAGI